MSETKAVFELITQGLERGPQGLVLGQRALDAVAARLAQASGEARAEGLVGVMTALDFLAREERSDPARAAVLAVFMAAFEAAQADSERSAAFERRLRELTGGAPELKLPTPQARPEGTIPAGPGARFMLTPEATEKKPKRR